MIAHLQGKLVEKQPSYVIIECSGVGYEVLISLFTYERIRNEEACKLLIHYSVSVDVRSGASQHQLFGFTTGQERELFRSLINISGVSSNIARTILSSLSPDELHSAVVSGDVKRFRGVKGIGPKLAQRIVADLQDKKAAQALSLDNLTSSHNTARGEALIALCSLGFERLKAEQAIEKALADRGSDLPVEDLIKLALKMM